MHRTSGSSNLLRPGGSRSFRKLAACTIATSARRRSLAPPVLSTERGLEIHVRLPLPSLSRLWPDRARPGLRLPVAYVHVPTRLRVLDLLTDRGCSCASRRGFGEGQGQDSSHAIANFAWDRVVPYQRLLYQKH